jgi:hypothetical protein
MTERKPKQHRMADNTDTSFYQFDADLGFWGIPNMERDVSFQQRRGELVLVRHNEEGNRDSSFVVGRDRADVLCIGGSHTWGGGVRAEERYSDQLQQMTGQRVVNLGHCSLGLDQVCLALLQRAERYAPRVIVVEQYPWALHRVLNVHVNGYVKPQFYLDGAGKLQLRKLPRAARYPLSRKVIGSFHTYRKELLEHLAGINLKAAYDPRTDPIFLLWKSSYYQYMYEMVDKILGVIRDYCRERHITLVFAIGAIVQQFGPPSASELIDFNLPRDRFVALLDKNGISYVDMVPAMLAEHSDADPVIFSDGHINEKGNRVFAGSLRDWLRAHQLAA